MDLTKRALLVKKMSKELGFDYCGISTACFLEEEAPRLERWLHQRAHGQMQYMENHFDKRLDPALLVPGARSVISLLYNHYPAADHAKQTPEASPLKIAKYAYGEDYHFVIKRKLHDFFQRLTEAFGQIDGRVFVDSAPVMERAWAKRVGWAGSANTLC